MDEQLPSVRIDIDSSSADTDGLLSPASPESPGEQAASRSRWLTLGIVLAVLALTAAVLLVLRPEDGETALGDARQPTPTTQPESTANELEAPTDSETTTTLPEGDERPPGVEQSVLSPTISPFGLSIVRIDDDSPNSGYWILSPRNSLAGPLILRSSDGLTWSPLDHDLATGPPNQEPQYGPIVERPSGLEVVRELFDDDGLPSGLERLVSTDGRSWALETSYQAAERSFGLLNFTSHSASSLVYPSGELAQTRLDRLLRAALRPDVELPESGVCFTDPSSVQLLVFGCQEDETAIEIGDDDFIDTDSIGETRNCARALGGRSFFARLPRERTLNRFEDSLTTTFESTAVPLGNVVQSDGTIVAVSLAVPTVPECDSVLGEQDTADPFLELWHTDGSVETIALPGPELTGSRLPDSSPPLPLVDDDDEIYVYWAGDIWHFDPTLATWNRRLTFPTDNGFEFAPVLVAGGRVLVVNQGRLFIGDLETGEITVKPVTTSSRDSLALLVHADDMYAFIALSGEFQLVRVELP